MKLIGYFNERNQPVFKEMTKHDLEYCRISGFDLIFSQFARDYKAS